MGLVLSISSADDAGGAGRAPSAAATESRSFKPFKLGLYEDVD